MASISSLGIGSGLDVHGLVTQLVAAERQPTDLRHTLAERTSQARISAFGAISSSLSALEESLKAFEGLGANLGRSVTTGDGAGFTATADASAATGRFMVTVESLATAHRLQSAAVASDTQLGHGTLTITVGGDEPLTVDIAEGKGTLAGIRDAINAKSGGSGVTAAVVRGDDGDVLVLSSTRTGSDGTISIGASGGDGGLAALATTGGSITTTTAAADAVVVVDGVTRTSSSNTLDDLIDGVSLKLSKATPGEAFALEIGNDSAPLKEGLDKFVSAYNKALKTLATQSASGSGNGTGGPLSGDSTARALTSTLRNTISSSYVQLSALGFKTAVDGTLSLDAAAFEKAIASTPDAVKGLLGPEAGLGKGLRDTLGLYIGNDGMLKDRTDGLEERLDALDAQREAFDRRMAKVEEAYRRQFTALDMMMAQMKSTSDYITQQFSNLNQNNK